MGHETANGGGRGLGYMLFNAHLCNQPYSYKVVVGPGTQLCTLSEVWVLRVGVSTLGRKRLCMPRIGDPQVPMTQEHPQCGFAAPGLILRQRFQIGVFRPIRVDQTNCLQVAIKTHSIQFQSICLHSLSFLSLSSLTLVDQLLFLILL